MFSYYKRYKGPTEQFSDFCNRIYSDVITISFQDYWSIYYALLMNVSSNFISISFEDSKSNGFNSVIRILDFLGERRGITDIAAAVEISGVKNVPKAISENLKTGCAAQGGNPLEFLEHVHADDIINLKGIPLVVMDNLAGADDTLINDLSLEHIFSILEHATKHEVPQRIIHSISHYDFHRITHAIKMNSVARSHAY